MLLDMPNFGEMYSSSFVWCDYAESEAVTRYGHCEFCGETDHEELNKDV